MKLLSLLAVVIVLTTQTLACNYERIYHDPKYAEISKPKKSISVPMARGVCVAPNGDFVIVTHNKIHIYYSCGKSIKAFDFGNGPIYMPLTAHSQAAISSLFPTTVESSS